MRSLAAIFGPLSQLRDLVLRFFDARIHLPDGFFVSAWRRDSWDWRASANFTGRTARTAPGKQRTAILAAVSTANAHITQNYERRSRPTDVPFSRGYSFYFRKMLSLCAIDLAHSEPGTEVVVVWGNPGTPQKEIRATVAPAPYKKDNRRADVAALPLKALSNG